MFIWIWRLALALVVASSWVGVAFLAQDIQGLPSALRAWRALVPIDGTTALLWFSAALAGWVIWIDLRPLILPAIQKRLGLGEFDRQITLTEVGDIAKRRYGWELGDDSLQSLDLIDGLRQAGIDGRLVFEGRHNARNVPENMKQYHPLQPIPTAPFSKLQL